MVLVHPHLTLHGDHHLVLCSRLRQAVSTTPTAPLLPSQAPLAAPPRLQVASWPVAAPASFQSPGLELCTTEVKVQETSHTHETWGLLLQPAHPCILAATIPVRLRNSYCLSFAQAQFGRDFVDKGPEPRHCIHHCCCPPVLSPSHPWRVTLEKSWPVRDLGDPWDPWETEKQQVS